MVLDRHIAFEQCVAKIFNKTGYGVEQEALVEHSYNHIEILAEKDGNQYCIEVKYRLINDKAASRIVEISEKVKMIPILVVGEQISRMKRTYYSEKYAQLIILDISNLLYVVRKADELRNELIACLNYSIEDIEPSPCFIEVDVSTHVSYTQSLIEKMEQCLKGRSMSRTYEVLCCELLKNAFSDDLTLWKDQESSNKNLYRFDLLCRIKDGNQKTFWSIIERFFNSKYVVFEFKNYTEAVTQKEIYTTEKYLYAKALRCVAIMVAQNGYDENACWAAKGCLRENGKLLILLDTNDLIEMNKIKEKQEDPAEYLLDKLDNLLLDLEK